MTNKLAAWTIAASAAFLALTAAPSLTPAQASEPTATMTSNVPLREVALGIGKSIVVDLPRDAKDVLVSDPAIANAVVRTARRAYIIGVKVGQANVFFFDGEGRQIAGFDVAVKRDLNGIRAAIRHAIPNADIRVEPLGPNVILTGVANSTAEAQMAFDITLRLLDYPAAQAVAEGSKVVNAITVRGRDQVMLKVTVAEVQRDIVKQLGVNFNGSLGYGNTVLNFNTENPFSVSNGAISNTAFTPGWKSGTNSISATIQAMERAGVMRTLAEPNLTAISGENANFLVGGEFPIPTGRTCDPGTGSCQTTITFKKFGISLNFTPVVLSEGRMSLKVNTEVSELSSEGALVQAGISIPSIRVRRADTTVEIPSGGALAMAGLIQEQTKQAINGLPGLMQVPVLGTLFKSRDYVNRQSELVIIVTPYIVRAVAPKDISRPDDGFVDSSDPTAILLGKFNKIYGVAGSANPRKPYRGQYGYILD